MNDSEKKALPVSSNRYVRSKVANRACASSIRCHGDGARSLLPNYTIFGQVRSGMDVVNAIATAPVQANGSGESSTPVNPVRIARVTIDEQ